MSNLRNTSMTEPTTGRSDAQVRRLRSRPSQWPATGNAYHIVREKQQWHSVPPNDQEAAKGFTGWRTRGYLPHFDRAGLYQFITFRLDDALPAERRREWEPLLAIGGERERIIEIEAYLDKGHGSCHLRKAPIAELMERALLHFDTERYRLFAWTVMPNHVHALIEVIHVPLAQILHSWKAFTSLKANRILNRSGRFWQVEYFDRYMRDLEHFRKTVRYIENNPIKAGLVRAPEQWPWSSARFFDAKQDRNAGVQPARRSMEICSPTQTESPTAEGNRAG